jgi:uncharacterized protein (TIGR02099 family)
MPFVRASLRAPRAYFFVLLRFLRTVAVTGIGAFALALLLVRFVVFPHVESYRDTLASLLAKELGHPVEIAALTTGWDGWNPKLIVEGFRVLDRARVGATPLLELPELAMTVAWTSLPLLELRFKELVIERPRLAVRRDRAGVLHMAGMEIDPAQMPDDSPVTEWILRQPEIVIRDALITWDDDLRNAPQLILDRVQFRLESRFGHHRFGLKGVPPAELAAPLDLRGNLTGAALKDWQHVDGEVFVRLDYADVAAWREWLPLPGQIASGKGALRIWFQFARGEPREIVADLELADVKARLADDLPELDLDHLTGRAGWRSDETRHEMFTRNLAFTTRDGERLDPTNFTLTLNDPTQTRPASGQIAFDRLQLDPLAAFGAHLPLPTRIRADLARFAPRGTLSQGRLQWEGPAEAPTAYSASAEFTKLGMIAQDVLPGATGVSGRFEMTDERGAVEMASSNAVLDLPRVFRAPIALDTVQGAVKWERRAGTTTIRVERLEFANADVAGSASGTYRTAARGPGEIDFVANATRGDARQVHRYLPRSINDVTRNWLHTALVGGVASEARLKIAGNLADFPFAPGHGGQFVVTARAKGVTLDYADGWAPLTDIDADVRIDGTRLTVDGTRGRVYGVEIGKTRAEIADLAASVPLLRIIGEAAGPVTGFTRYVSDRAVAARTGNIADGIEATGDGHLALRLALPLGRPDEIRVSGDFTVADAQLRIAGAPYMSKINGTLAFTEREVRARDVDLEVLGGPARITIASAEGPARVTGSGTVNLNVLRRELAIPYLDHVSGTVDWTIGGDVRPGASTWVLESTMKGALVDLPAPLGKAATEVMPVRIERRDDTVQAGADFVTATYGRVAQLAAYRRPGATGTTVDRVLLSLGRAVDRPDAARADRPGMWIRAELPALNLDDWFALTGSEATAEARRRGPVFAGADLDVGQLDVFGARFREIELRIRESQGGWQVDLDGPSASGIATWSAPDTGAPNGRIVARLVRLAIPGRPGSAPGRAADGKDASDESKREAAAVSRWPAIDVAADALLSKDRDLGRFELVAKPRGAEWRIERLVLANDSGRIDAGGEWSVAGRQPQTRLDVTIDAKEAGAFMARFGYPDALQGAPAKIDGQLEWSGAPHEFDYPTLAGTFHVQVGPGRFTRIEPGPGKLLGVLSLQALPRRVTLDFRDVFSDGFAFDEIAGDVRIGNGSMTTSNLKLVGPAAKVDIAGDADLAQETQRLSVHVQPALSSSVSAGAALLFLANPLVGAAIGAGSLLAQTMLKDPIEQIFSYEYTVTGSWSDPVVTRSSAANASVPPGSQALPVAGAIR